MVQRLVQVTLLAALMAGCAMAPSTAPTPQAPMTVEQELAPGSPAMELYQHARQARQQGNQGAAGRYLERALTMAPDSSWLYRELADLHLSQGDARGAEGFALRALRLAPDNTAYRAGLWEMVATARARQGNQAGADNARAHAEQLREPSTT
ncbi:MAG: tetratricopeptide repeat protein [Alcanivorax sp.]|nr:tetratricopeptide repeat protein [Alcanivorax sp.]